MDKKLLEIKTRRYEIEEEEEDLKNQVRETGAKLTLIKNHIRTGGLMPSEKYQKFCDTQNETIKKKLDLEKKLGKLKVEKRKLADQEYFFYGNPKKQEAENQEIESNQNEIKAAVQQLVELRLKYQEFSADSTRASSMRSMASKFVLDINKVVKSLINN
jgi:hypothetical protein